MPWLFSVHQEEVDEEVRTALRLHEDDRQNDLPLRRLISGNQSGRSAGEFQTRIESVGQYYKRDRPRDRPRDPVALIRDSRFRRVLLDAVRDVAGERQFELAAAGKAALYEARRKWLLKLIHDSAAGELPDVEDKLQILERRTSAKTFDEFSEAVDELKKSDLLPAATRTIQAGLMDEYGWLKLEEVFESIAGEFQSKHGTAGTHRH